MGTAAYIRARGAGVAARSRDPIDPACRDELLHRSEIDFLGPAEGRTGSAIIQSALDQLFEPLHPFGLF
jgi:hypothetical protein